MLIEIRKLLLDLMGLFVLDSESNISESFFLEIIKNES